MSSMAVNIYTQVFLWMYVFVFLKHSARSGIAALLFVLIQAFGDLRMLCSLLKEPFEVGVLVALILCLCLF